MATMASEKLSPESMLELVKTFMNNGVAGQVKEMLRDAKYTAIFKALAWDLVPVFCKNISEKTYHSEPGVYEASEEGLEKLAEIGNPKELLLVLLEEADAFKEDMKFYMLLKLIQKCLIRIGPKKAYSIGLAMETLYAHLLTLEQPNDSLEDDELKLLDVDPTVRRILDASMAVIQFLQPFCLEIKGLYQKGDVKSGNKQTMEVTRYLLKLLEQPIGYLDTSVKEGEAESESRSLTKKLMKLMNHAHSDAHTAIRRFKQKNQVLKSIMENGIKDGAEDDHVDREEEPLSETGIAVYTYLVYGEGFAVDNLPQVFTHKYNLEFCYQYAVKLTQNQSNMFIRKGIILLNNVIDKLKSQSLDFVYVQSELIKDLTVCIKRTATLCPLLDVRQAALKLVPMLLEKFDYKGRNHFIRHLIKCSDHAGMAGYAVNLLKQEIDAQLSLLIPSEYFTGQHLAQLLRFVFFLKNGVTTDLLDERDMILGSLNLLRYLLIRDKPDRNQTGIWDLVPELEMTYCSTLRTSLNMSESHYKLEIEKIKRGESDWNAPELKMSVSGLPTPNLSEDQQIDFFQAAIVTCDMINSVLGRVSELMDTHKK